jgi:hypothetical protein
VLFNFPTAGPQIDLAKSTNVVNGTFLAPQRSLVYHNPAAFNGAVIAKNLDLHANANLNNGDASPAPSSLSGFVDQVGGVPVVGVTLVLSDAGGNTVATTTTAADGSYSFAGLGAGTYTITLVVSTSTSVASQAGTVNGSVDGTAVGSQISAIGLAAGQDGVQYDFLLGGQPQ